MPGTANNIVLEESLGQAYARWRDVVEAELKGASFDKKLVTRTFDGPAVQPLYTRANLAGVPHLSTKPGAAPYLRGVRPLGYKTRGWEIGQTILADSAAEFNAALLTDLMAGQNSVVLTPDFVTRTGGSSAEAASRAIASRGIPLVNADDIVVALKAVDLGAVPVHLHAGADALPLAALYVEAMRRQGVNLKNLSGSLTADPLGEWVSLGTAPTSIDALYGSLATWTSWAEAEAPELRTISVDAALWSNDGGTATQELAFALATAVEYLRALDDRGVKVASASCRYVFNFAIGPQFFSEIAKFRAFRPLWTRALTAFGVQPEAASGASVAAATGMWNKTLLDPHVNMLRVTTEALSAVLGGCDRLHISPFDEVTGASNEFSRRIARNVHTLLAEEFNFAQTADPAGGSWYAEKLTDELARTAWTLFQEIERRGGMAAALRSGYPQELVAKAAAEKKDAIAKRRVGIVGTNIFPNLRETPLAVSRSTLKPAQTSENQQDRFPRATELADAVQSFDTPTRFSAALSAAREGATVDQLRRVISGAVSPGETIRSIAPHRAAEDFEALRTASAEFAQRTGARPRVFLAKIGPTSQHKARADFSAGFFAVGGFEMLAKQSFATADEAAAAAASSTAQVVVLCSTDETYPVLVPEFGSAIRRASPGTILVLAGLPADAETTATYRKAGIDEFIHLRASARDVLAAFLKKMGVL